MNSFIYWPLAMRVFTLIRFLAHGYARAVTVALQALLEAGGLFERSGLAIQLIQFFRSGDGASATLQ